MSSTGPRMLIDNETGTVIGQATDEQADASDHTTENGVILIDAEGDVVWDGAWAAQQPGVRRVWVR